MALKRQTLLKVILILVVSIEASEVLKHVYIDRVICQFNKDYCRNTLCRLRFLNRTTKALSYRCDSDKIVDDLVFRVSLFYRYTSGYKMFLINNVKIDYCEYASNKTSVTSSAARLLMLVQRRVAMIKEEFATFTRCPVNIYCTLNNLTLDGNMFPKAFIPTGSYYVNVELKTHNDRIVLVKTYFEVPAGKTIDDDRLMG